MAESSSGSNDKRVQIERDDKYSQTQKVDARRQLQNSPMLVNKICPRVFQISIFN